MTWRAAAGLLVLVSLVVHLWLFPPKPYSDEYHDQFCLTRGCTRSVRIYRIEGSSTESEEKMLPNSLASYTTAMLGPCPGHRWISYHGGYTQSVTGLAGYFSMKTNATFSGSSRQLITLGMRYQFDGVRHIFQGMYKRDPELLKRVLTYILQRYEKDRWDRFDEFMDLLDPPGGGWKSLRVKLDELEREP